MITILHFLFNSGNLKLIYVHNNKNIKNIIVVRKVLKRVGYDSSFSEYLFFNMFLHTHIIY